MDLLHFILWILLCLLNESVKFFPAHPPIYLVFLSYFIGLILHSLLNISVIFYLVDPSQFIWGTVYLVDQSQFIKWTHQIYVVEISHFIHGLITFHAGDLLQLSIYQQCL